MSYHTNIRIMSGDESVGKGIKAAIEAAKAWHGSAEGLVWHKENGRLSWSKKVKSEELCTFCGHKYMVFQGARKRGFCSAKCQSAARRASGVDDETRECVFCHKEYVVNKYKENKCCSNRCASSLRQEARKSL
ncbi:unnamed protein product [marine sediment metagenome]|uniref:Uncharacterized protein n=1 Tax=marine sediment metagenome TaxID=412755 RepID=X0XF02_9ZZZZ